MDIQVLSSQTIELERNRVSILGPNLEMHDCTVFRRLMAKAWLLPD